MKVISGMVAAICMVFMLVTGAYSNEIDQLTEKALLLVGSGKQCMYRDDYACAETYFKSTMKMVKKYHLSVPDITDIAYDLDAALTFQNKTDEAKKLEYRYVLTPEAYLSLEQAKEKREEQKEAQLRKQDEEQERIEREKREQWRKEHPEEVAREEQARREAEQAQEAAEQARREQEGDRDAREKDEHTSECVADKQELLKVTYLLGQGYWNQYMDKYNTLREKMVSDKCLVFDNCEEDNYRYMCQIAYNLNGCPIAELPWRISCKACSDAIRKKEIDAVRKSLSNN